MLLKMVTGSNSHLTKFEFKATDIGSLKSSLCSMVLHCKQDLLHYGISQDGEVKLLKTIFWEGKEGEILAQEFDANQAFKSVTALSFSLNEVVLPKSLQEKADDFHLLKELPCSDQNQLFGQFIRFHFSELHKTAVRNAFPECTLKCTSHAAVNKLNFDSRYAMSICSNSSSTKLTLLDGSNLLLKQAYHTPDIQSVLYFALNALKVNNIEDGNNCTFIISGEDRNTEIYELFTEYFEQVQIGTPAGALPDGLSETEALPYYFVLNTL